MIFQAMPEHVNSPVRKKKRFIPSLGCRNEYFPGVLVSWTPLSAARLGQQPSIPLACHGGRGDLTPPKKNSL